MYKKILAAVLTASLSLGTFAQDKMYLIKDNEVVAKYNVTDVDYVSFELPAGVVDNTGNQPSVRNRVYLSAIGSYFGTTDDVADYQIQFKTRTVMDENTPVEFLYLQLMGPAADYHNLSLPEGTYTVQNGDVRKAFTFYKGIRDITLEGEAVGGSIVIERPNNEDMVSVLVESGSFTITKEGNGYAISGLLKLDNGEVLEFAYNGACVVENQSDEKDPADILPLPESVMTADVDFTAGEAYFGNYGVLLEDKPNFIYNFVYLYSSDYAEILEMGILVDKTKAGNIVLPKGKYQVATLGSTEYNSGNNVALAAFQVMGDMAIGTYGCWITTNYTDMSPLVSGEVEILEDFNGTNDLKIKVNLKDNSATPHAVTVSSSGKAEKLDL